MQISQQLQYLATVAIQLMFMLADINVAVNDWATV